MACASGATSSSSAPTRRRPRPRGTATAAWYPETSSKSSYPRKAHNSDHLADDTATALAANPVAAAFSDSLTQFLPARLPALDRWHPTPPRAAHHPDRRHDRSPRRRNQTATQTITGACERYPVSPRPTLQRAARQPSTSSTLVPMSGLSLRTTLAYEDLPDAPGHRLQLIDRAFSRAAASRILPQSTIAEVTAGVQNLISLVGRSNRLVYERE
jgi:hypothetical protein